MEQNERLVTGPAGSRQEKSPSPIGSCSGLRSTARASSSSSSSRLCESKQTAEHEPGRFTNQNARGPSAGYRTSIFKCLRLAASTVEVNSREPSRIFSRKPPASSWHLRNWTRCPLREELTHRQLQNKRPNLTNKPPRLRSSGLLLSEGLAEQGRISKAKEGLLGKVTGRSLSRTTHHSCKDRVKPTFRPVSHWRDFFSFLFFKALRSTRAGTLCSSAQPRRGGREKLHHLLQMLFKLLQAKWLTLRFHVCLDFQVALHIP